ncbi:MAG: IPT/TIG domain-containing protein [Bacteroidota bacterium]
MKAHLQKLLKASGLLLLLLTVTPSCKKETTIKPLPPTPEVKASSLKGKIDGKDFAIKENGIKSTLYSTSGDGVKSLETAATLDADGSKLTFFIDDLKNGAIALSKKSGTSLNPGTKTIRINSTTPVQSYVYYYSSGNEYYAFSGSIEITVTDTDITVKWNIMFKDAGGREFNSSGSFTITYASVVTKSKTEVKDPTPVADKPTIESITPNRGRAGDVVAIAGVNYSTTIADNIVKFNGVNAVVTSATATKLMVKAPTEGTTGTVSVKVKNSEVTTGPVFSYIGAATFTSFAPASAKAGDIITITGTNFSETLADNVVHFSGPQNTVFTGTVTAVTETQLKVTVPQGAITGKIYLTVNSGQKLTSNTDFTLTTPQTTGDWEMMSFDASIQESNISAASGNGFMFAGGSNSKYLYYSEDGTTYTNVYDRMQSTNGEAIEVHLIKTDGVYYYITTNQGIFRTNGTTWKKLSPWAASPNMSVTGLIASRGGNLTCISGTLLFTSSDSGDSWTLSQASTPNTSTLDYLTSDGFGKYWYAVDMSSNFLSSTNPRKIYKSTDKGKTWTAGAATTGIYFFGSGNQDFITASGYNIFCLFSPSTASIYDQRLYKTSDQGATWTKLSDDNVYYVKSFGDYVVYGDGRFNVSIDGGATFKNYDMPTGYRVGGVERSNGYFYAFAFSNTGKQRIFRKKI